MQDKMLKAFRTGWRKLRIEEDGRSLTTLDAGGWRSTGAFDLGEERFAVHRAPFWGEFRLQADDKVICRAKKKWARTAFEIRFDNQHFLLEKEDWVGLDLALRTRDGKRIGSIRSGTEMKIAVRQSVPLSIKLFLFWLAFRAWRSTESGGNGG